MAGDSISMALTIICTLKAGPFRLSFLLLLRVRELACGTNTSSSRRRIYSPGLTTGSLSLRDGVASMCVVDSEADISSSTSRIAPPWWESFLRWAMRALQVTTLSLLYCSFCKLSSIALQSDTRKLNFFQRDTYSLLLKNSAISDKQTRRAVSKHGAPLGYRLV